MPEDNLTIKKRNYYKIFFILFLVVSVLEGGWIYLSSKYKNFVILPPYSLTDSVEGLVIAKGSWLSTTELANPLQTVQIECWKDFGHCWIMDSYINDDNFLSLGSSIAEIAKWDTNVIETVPVQTGFGCVEYSYRIDRRSRTVTSVRSTVDNQSDSCKGIQDEPIIMNLGNKN